MQKEKRPPNYRGLFLFGVILIILGTNFIIFDTFSWSIGLAFLAIGCIFMMAGFRHKDKWMAGNGEGRQEEK